MAELPLRVIKVGGSLLNRPDLTSLLTKWLGKQSPARQALIAGGGDLANAVRRWDQTHQLDQETSHWLAIDTLRVTSKLLARLLPGSSFFSTQQALLNSSTKSNLLVIDPVSFLMVEEPELEGTRLPWSWDVTTDSIAARFAITAQASELVLLKAASPPQVAGSLALLAEAGYVDRFLPQLERELPPLRLVDLPGGSEICLSVKA